MNSTSKKLIAVIVSMAVLLVVMVALIAQLAITSVNKQPVSAPTQSGAVSDIQTGNGSGIQNPVAGDQNQTPVNPVSEVTTAAQTGEGAQTPAQGGAMTDQQALDMLSTAVNKAKARKDGFSVHRVKSFDISVTDCTGGSVVANLANQVVGKVVKPFDETVNFSNGSATASNGDVLTNLLPQKGNFNLNLNQIKSISATKNGADTVIDVTLAPETSTLSQPPAANAGSIGFLDLGSLDISIVDITQADATYAGSTIKMIINESGDVVYAEYHIPIKLVATAKKGPISGTATIEGSQTEYWDYR